MDEQNQCCNTEKIPGFGEGGKRITPFNDCGIEEKVARLHAEVIHNRQIINWLSNTVSDLRTEIHRLKNHAHVDNKVLIPIDVVNNNGMPGSEIRGFDYLA